MARMDRKDMLERMRDFASAKYGRAIGKDVGFATPAAVCEAATPGRERYIKSIISTDRTDLESEVVLPGGCQRKKYFDFNKSVFRDHEYDLLSCVGKCRNLDTLLGLGGGSNIKATTVLLNDENNPYVKAIWAMAQMPEGVACSVGYEALDRGKPTAEEKARYPKAKSIVRAWEMLEYSFTPMPMNCSCISLEAGEWTEDDSKSAARREVLVKAGLSSVLEAFRLKIDPPRRVLVWDVA